MRWLLILLCVASCCSTPVFAQFTLLSTSPTDGAVNVPLLSSVSFTFSEPLDTAARFNEFDNCLAMIAHEPEDSIGVLGVSFNEDLTVITFSLQHTANTDFVYFVTNARSLSGLDLEQPFGLCYTTAAEYESNTVSGTISYADGSPQFAVVVLTNIPGDGEGTPQPLAMTAVLGTDGQYTINHVRNGVYWPMSALDLNRDGEVNYSDPAALYDYNDDGHSDSIVVNGTNVTGIDLVLEPRSAVEPPQAALPQRVSLAQNYPNPFNPETVISFTLPRAMAASVKVFDVLGREIATLASGPQSAGTHALTWNAGGQPGGIYFYRLDAGTQSLTQKMLLVK